MGPSQDHLSLVIFLMTLVSFICWWLYKFFYILYATHTGVLALARKPTGLRRLFYFKKLHLLVYLNGGYEGKEFRVCWKLPGHSHTSSANVIFSNLLHMDHFLDIIGCLDCHHKTAKYQIPCWHDYVYNFMMTKIISGSSGSSHKI